jgi:hypothetical protein
MLAQGSTRCARLVRVTFDPSVSTIDTRSVATKSSTSSVASLNGIMHLQVPREQVFAIEDHFARGANMFTRFLVIVRVPG